MSFVTRRNRSSGAGSMWPHVISEEIDIDASAPSRVRAMVRRVAAETPVVEDALLLSSEITTNAIMHGTWLPGDELTVTVELRPHRLFVSVTGPGEPQPISPSDRRTPGGFGLDLVDSISEKWAMEPVRGEATRVWFELAW